MYTSKEVIDSGREGIMEAKMWNTSCGMLSKSEWAKGTNHPRWVVEQYHIWEEDFAAAVSD